MEVCIKHLPASEGRLKQYVEAQLADPVCSAVMKHCQDEWPERHKIEPVLKPYWKVQGHLSVHASFPKAYCGARAGDISQTPPQASRHCEMQA